MPPDPPPAPSPPRPPRPPGSGDGGDTPRPGSSSRWWWWVAALILLNLLIVNAIFGGGQESGRVSISYSAFLSQVEGGNVTSVNSTDSTIDGHAGKPVTSADGSQSGTDFTTVRPAYATDDLLQLLRDRKVTVSASASSTSGTGSLWLNLLLMFGPALLLIAGMVWLFRRAAAGGGAGGAGVFGMGRSQARLYDAERPTTTFADVAGIDEATEELQEIVDFLRDPTKYQRLGGTMPKGVLLVGAPGSGKTLLARAVAGEARVPFYSVSASEFVEMIVGVGAARVRDLFAKARKAAPAIIFIDELDAIGRSRGGTVRIGGHDEQEQTLNQILTEMDGFDSREGVVVLSATNRPDVLDSALLRAGRFDRRVAVHPPDRAGRVAILRIHTRGVPLSPDVDMERLGSMTTGLVGADLRNLVNEAALLAARRGRDAVTSDDFGDAFEKVLLGAERHIALSEHDRQRTAYHESGHALVALLTPGADPVRKMSIVPRARSLGATLQSPVDDRQDYQEDYLRGRIASAVGGRGAELEVYGIASTGAQDDLRQATLLAREMVTHWGMSEAVGPVSIDDGDGMAMPLRQVSDATAQLVDSEVRRIVTDALAVARGVLREHRPQLDALAAALLRDETLDEPEIRRLAGVAPRGDGEMPAPSPQPAHRNGRAEMAAPRASAGRTFPSP